MDTQLRQIELELRQRELMVKERSLEVKEGGKAVLMEKLEVWQGRVDIFAVTAASHNRG